MRKIFISIFIFVSCFLFADVSEWEFGKVVDEMTGQESHTLVVMSSSSNVSLIYYCNNGIVTVSSSFIEFYSQINRARVDDNEVSYYNWIQSNLSPEMVHLVDVKYNPERFFSGDQLTLELITYIVDEGQEYKEIEYFEFPISGWNSAVEEHCSDA